MQKSNSEKKRSSGLELLRIVCIFMIMLGHYSVYGGYNELSFSPTVGEVFVQVIGMFSRMACSIFALITGYFMISSKVNYKKIILLLAEIVFYAYFAFFILYGTRLIPMDALALKLLVPFLGGGNWYLTYYIIFSLFIPFFNPMLKALGQKKHLQLLVILIIVWSVIPTFTIRRWNFSSLDFFIVMYVIGSYIRLYPSPFLEKRKVSLSVAAVSFMLMVLSVIVIDFLGYITKLEILTKWAVYFQEYNMILPLMCAVSLFLLFKNTNFYSRFTNWIALSVPGIYLLHENARSLIWTRISPNKEYVNTPYVVLHAFLKVMIIFLVCLAIDKIRVITVEKLFTRWLDKIYEPWKEKLLVRHKPTIL